MTTQLPPTIDPQAAARWDAARQNASPWLHEEVARRMEARLDWMTKKPSSWVHWEPLRGGLRAQELLEQRYQKSECFVVQAHEGQAQEAIEKIAKSWWNPARWSGPRLRFGKPGQPVQMLWANMALHMAADPQSLIAQWHSLLDTDGFLMFSCLGPDTLQELRRVYAAMGWPPASHEFTDMHDWGDMLVQAGFAEPVMDVERITLTFATPQRLLLELRELGRNLHPKRFAGLRGRQWHATLLAELGQQAVSEGAIDALPLTFEIIYGHAFKPPPRHPVRAETRLSLEEMRITLRQINKKPQGD